MLVLLLLGSIRFSPCFGQTGGEKDSLPATVPADTLGHLIHAIQRGATDQIRSDANKAYTAMLDSLLRLPEAMSASFDSFKNLSVVTSADRKIRFYTWIVPRYDGNAYEFYGYLQSKDPETGTVNLWNLQDSTSVIAKPESEKLRPQRWLGTVYYSIIEKKTGKKTYYILLGWKGKDRLTTQKIIEVFSIEKSGPRFGYPLFKTGKVYRNRMVFSFTSQASMTLRYEEGKNAIVFDHLSSSGKSQENASPSSLSGPDGTYDIFKYKSGKWILYQDIDIRTDWKPRKEPAQTPKTNGE